MVTFPYFELLAHELPPTSTEPLCAPAHARIEVEGQEVLLRVVKVEKWRYVVFLRREGQNFILEHSSSEVMIWKTRPVPRKLERIGRYVARRRLFFPTRFLVVTDGDEVPRPLLAGTRTGIRYLSNVNGTYSYKCHWLRSDLSRGADFSFEDNGDFLGSLQQALSDPGSYANRMWQFQQMTPAERAAFDERSLAKRRDNRPKNRFIRFWKRLRGISCLLLLASCF